MEMPINGLTTAIKLHIIYLIREPLVSVHLTAGKISVIKNSALLYQSRGAIFYVCIKIPDDKMVMPVCGHGLQ